MIHYKCSLCGREYNRKDIKYLCPQCSKDYKPGEPLKGVLQTVFDYDFIRINFDKISPDINLFSAVVEKYYPHLPVGNTPFYKSNNLTHSVALENVFIKNDSLNPSGSLKDRATQLIIAEANRLHEKTIIAASTGNAASSLAAMCASENKEAIIFVPESAPKAKILQMTIFGAKVIKVSGNYDEAYRLSIEYTNENPGLNRNTAYHPLTIEGKKTAGLEIFFQNNFKVPDYIFIPVGDGVILGGIYKAFYDLKQAGLCEKLPKLISVQAEKSNAINNFILTGEYKNVLDSYTIADSISVNAPANAYMAANAVKESGGFPVNVSDLEIMQAQQELAGFTGIYAEPAASSVFAALKKTKNDIDETEQVVLLITGTGLKDTESTIKYLKL